MAFDYFYGNQAEMFSYFRIPYALVREKVFASLSLESKILYGLLLDRMGLSRKNQWVDAEGRVFIIYPISEIEEELAVSKKLAMKYLNELERFGLIEKRKQGMNKPNILYIKSFLIQEKATVSKIGFSGGAQMGTSKESEEGGGTDTEGEIRGHQSKSYRYLKLVGVLKQELPGVPKQELLGVPKQELPEVPKWEPNHTNNNHTKSHTQSILSEDEIRSRATKEWLWENLEMEKLLVEYPEDTGLLKGIFDLLLQTAQTSEKTIWVAKKEQDKTLVVSRLLGLRAAHIRYVIECLESRASGDIGNMKQYLLTMLFQAPVTMDAYYKAKAGAKTVHQKNRFVNYQQSNWDFDEIERLEREQRMNW